MNAALQPDRWPDALQVMANHTNSARGQLIGLGGMRDVPFNIVTNFEQSALEEFLEIGGASPTLNYRVAASAEDVARGNYDRLLYEDHYDAVIPKLQSDRYVRWCVEHDLPFGCQANLVVDRVGLIGLAVLRTQKDGRTTPESRKIFAKASAAAQRAVRLQEKLEGEQARLIAGAFEAIAATAFILDARGQVQAMTSSAEEIVSSGAISFHDRMLESTGTPISLGRAIGALVADGGLDHIRLRLDCPSQVPFFVEGFRLPAREWSFRHIPHAILVVNAPQRDRAGIAAFLSALYRLTPAEADVAIRLYGAQTRADICAARSVTQETLRGQVKSICAKTETHSEAALMRLLAAFMA